jgi:hypothetical protein
MMEDLHVNTLHFGLSSSSPGICFLFCRASVGERRTNAIVVAIPSNVRDRILKDAEEQAGETTRRASFAPKNGSRLSSTKTM